MRPRSRKTIKAIQEETNRTLSSDERRAYLEMPMSDFERQQVLALTAWFQRRYPTGAERLAYVRKAYARWTTRADEPRD